MTSEAWDYIKSDLHRYARPFTWRTFLRHLRRNQSFRFSVALRLKSKAKNRFARWVGKRLHSRMRRKYGLQIPCSVNIGYGLYIGHGIGVVIHPKTVIGDNCDLSQFTTIGSDHDTPARIGDNVHIGPGVCIVEDVMIGDNSIIGAGAVVVKDVPPNCTVAGNPAKVISKNKRNLKRQSTEVPTTTICYHGSPCNNGSPEQ